jgi:hypothetical protein
VVGAHSPIVPISATSIIRLVKMMATKRMSVAIAPAYRGAMSSEILLNALPKKATSVQPWHDDLRPANNQSPRN